MTNLNVEPFIGFQPPNQSLTMSNNLEMTFHPIFCLNFQLTALGQKQTF